MFPIVLLAFISNYLQNKISYVVCTDISKDIILTIPSFYVYKQILEHYMFLKVEK